MKVHNFETVREQRAGGVCETVVCANLQLLQHLQHLRSPQHLQHLQLLQLRREVSKGLSSETRGERVVGVVGVVDYVPTTNLQLSSLTRERRSVGVEVSPSLQGERKVEVVPPLPRLMGGISRDRLHRNSASPAEGGCGASPRLHHHTPLSFSICRGSE